MARDDNTARIADAIERLGRLVRSRGYACNLNPAQWEVLRYLGRCNRVSSSPSALANFLGATKGTISQTVSSLERKGLLAKVPRRGQGRALSLVLTDQGRFLLEQDPQTELEVAAGELGFEAARLAGDLGHLLTECQIQCGIRSFGNCWTCRYFDSNAPEGNTYRCGLLGEHVAECEAGRICAEHTPKVRQA